jgi:hypothetical protein
MNDSPWSSDPSKRMNWSAHRGEELLSAHGYTGNDQKTKAHATWVRPLDFLRATTPPDGMQRLISESTPLNQVRLDAERQEMHLSGRFDVDNQRFVVEGHEGRHRMLALHKAGIEWVAITLCTSQGQVLGPLEGWSVTPQSWGELKAQSGFALGKTTPVSWAHAQTFMEEFASRSPDPSVPWGRMDEAANERPVSRNFAEFFSDSQVVDTKGWPLVVHHCGTLDERDEVDLVVSEQGLHFGTLAAAQERDAGKRIDDFVAAIEVSEGINEEGQPAWFWSSEGVDSSDMDLFGFSSAQLARTAAERFATQQDFSQTEPMPITSAYLSVSNPKRMRDRRNNWSGAIAEAKAQGHDGIVYKNEFEDKGSDSWIVFSPSQVKSVNNKGLFLRDSASLTDALADERMRLARHARKAKEAVQNMLKGIKAGMAP